jgi:hypothetical protein
MLKRFLALTSLTVVCSLSALAANSRFDGTWKINDTKSSWSDGNFPKNMSLTIDLKFTDDELTYHSVNNTVKEKTATSDYVARMDGKPYPLPGHTRYNQVTVRRISENDFEILELKDGDVIVGALWTFSSDGKHLVRWGVGKSPEGKSKAYIEYFDKQ